MHYWVVLIILSVVVSMTGRQVYQSEQISKNSHVSALARNLLVYRTALSTYAYEHPSFSGIVSDNDLELPDWYSRLPGVNGYVSAGHSYTYLVDPPAGLLSHVRGLTESVTVGLVSSSQIDGIPVPSYIPDGVLVIFQ